MILNSVTFLKQKINLITDTEIQGAVMDLIEFLELPEKVNRELTYFHTPISEILEILDKLNYPEDTNMSNLSDPVFTFEIVDYNMAVISYDGLLLLRSDEIMDFYNEELDRYDALELMIQKSLKKLRKKIKRYIRK